MSARVENDLKSDAMNPSCIEQRIMEEELTMAEAQEMAGYLDLERSGFYADLLSDADRARHS